MGPFASKLEKLKVIVGKYQSRQEITFNIRLGLGLIIVGFLFFPTLAMEWRLVGLGLSISSFVFFVIQSGKIRNHIEKLQLLSEFYQRQADRQSGQSTSLGGEKLSFVPPNLAPEAAQLNRDFDLFGTHSLWSFISETFSDFGKSSLSEAMVNPVLNAVEIQHRQMRVQTFSRYLGFIRKFIVLGHHGWVELSETHQLIARLREPGFTKRHFWILIGLFVLWVTFVAELFFGATGFQVFRFLFTMSSLISLAALRGVYGRAQNISVQFEKLVPVLSHLDKLDPRKKAELLPEFAKQNPIGKVRKFERALSALTVHAHPLINLFLNLVLPWNFFFAYLVEQTRKDLALVLPKLLEEMGRLEKTASLAIVSRYRKTCLPKFAMQPEFEIISLAHPMGGLNFISNDFKVGQSALILLTGSNMSGKSTFMRTLGVNQILALMGAPVFAEKFVTFLAPVRSCLRVSDSLREGASYFYAEVKRLKSILSEVRTGQLVFYLVDEIFKGTNNRERFLGSRDIILELAQSKSIGIISTHDLELAGLESDSKKIQNWHFTDNIENHQLVFHYKLKQGPSPSTNALKIMKLEGLLADT